MPSESGTSRREILRAGALSLFGLSLPQLSQLRALAAENSDLNSAARHRDNSCIFIFLFGGPSHIDLWDMKPTAPAEIRGDFNPVQTSVPDVHLCEHLPLLAQQMNRFALLRSMTHDMPVHGPACSQMFTGRDYFGPPTTDQALPEDWPALSALVNRFAPHEPGLPPSVVLPWYLQFHGQAKRIAGQTGGRMGEQHNPFLVLGDPSQPNFNLPGIRLPADVPADRLRHRRHLLDQVQSVATDRTPPPAPQTDRHDRHAQQAFDLLARAQTAGAFDLARESQSRRDAYGHTKFAQSLLLARRLVQAGVSLVTVNYDDDSRAEKVSPFWDTHHQNFPTLKDRLAPHFDRAFSAFLTDLDESGLLDTTLVVVTGEFGRTPKVGAVTQNGMTEKTGRDHWPHAFTVLLAGGGIRGGQVIGATNRTGGYVADRPVTPADLSATILYHLGIDTTQTYHDHFQRIPRRLSTGTPLTNLG